MANNFQRGDLTGVLWVPTGGLGQVLNVKDQDLDLSSLLYDVTGTLAGGVRARLAGPTDAAATILAQYDADSSPYLISPNITQGAGGLLVFYITAGDTRGIQVPMRIEKVHWKSGVETNVQYSFDAKCDSRVGVIVYPAA